ncbi:hypothetical protein BASA81_003826 [Batrachochytrium salamandrivorans]|nr:hypothetical protein BASA81_003826 [Batrachochytrium salamandrivorans]
MEFSTNDAQVLSPRPKRESRIPKEAFVWVHMSDKDVEEEVTEGEEDELMDLPEHDTSKEDDTPKSTPPGSPKGQLRKPYRFFRQLRTGSSSNPGSEDEDESSGKHRSLTFSMRSLNLRLSTAASSVPHAEKEIVFIRHGQSRDRKTLQSLVDANLSDKGILQATALSNTLAQDLFLQGDFLVVCSPLTRAIRTAALLFPHDNVPILVHPGFAELNNVGSSIPENTGRALTELLQDETVQPILSHPRVDSSRIANAEEWPPAADCEREEDHVHTMLQFLMSRPEKRICVVTHHHFIYSLFPSHFLPKLRRSHKAPTRVRNCFPIHTVVSSKPSIRIADEAHGWLCPPITAAEETPAV